MSDARMSGTAFGTIVLHISPESAVGGPLGFGAQRRSHQARCCEPLCRAAGGRCGAGEATQGVDRRRRCRKARSAVMRKLYRDHVQQADEGCDFDFMRENGK